MFLVGLEQIFPEIPVKNHRTAWAGGDLPGHPVPPRGVGRDAAR